MLENLYSIKVLYKLKFSFKKKYFKTNNTQWNTILYFHSIVV